MKSITIHLMLVQLKTVFLENIRPSLQRKFFLENPNIDMKDCGTLIQQIAKREGVSRTTALELSKEDMEKEADIIIDFLVKENIISTTISESDKL